MNIFYSDFPLFKENTMVYGLRYFQLIYSPFLDKILSNCYVLSSMKVSSNLLMKFGNKKGEHS